VEVREKEGEKRKKGGTSLSCNTFFNCPPFVGRVKEIRRKRANLLGPGVVTQQR